MNGIGIDYQQTLSILGLREGERPTTRTRLISDGWRNVVPHTATPEGLWGSEAFSQAPPHLITDQAPRPAGPWSDPSNAPLFWRLMALRVFQFLGRLQPVPKQGYRVVVALPAVRDSEAWAAVVRYAEQAGFDHAQFIEAPAALVCRWLAERPADERQAMLVAAVAVGDTSVVVSAYELTASHNTPGLPRIAPSPHLLCLEDMGFHDWCETLLAEVRHRLNEPVAAEQELLLRDGAIEFATRLRWAEPETLLPWTGPFHEQCYSTVTLARRECLRWPSVRRFATQLPALIRHAVAGLKGTAKPDVIVVGGIGAIWPFVADLLQHMAPVWHSPAPEYDIALGAAFWPLLETCFAAPMHSRQLTTAEAWSTSTATVRPETGAPESDETIGPEAPASLPLPDPSELPPWER